MNHVTNFALVVSLAAGAAVAGPLHFKTGTVDASTIQDVRNGRAGQRVPLRVVMQMNGPMDPDRRAAIQASGARILDYVPDNAFVLDMRDARMNAINALPFVEAVVPYNAAWKVDPSLGAMNYKTAPLRAITSQGETPAVVTLFAGVDIVATQKDLAAAGIKVLSTNLDADRFVLDVTGSEAAVRGLAQLESVQWIEPAPEVTFRNSTNRWVVQSNISGSFPVYDAGLRGEGQIIAIMDGRVSINHCSFSDPEGDPVGDDHRKIQAYNTSLGSDFHGTHVAGTALGDNGVDNDTRGVAYMARMVFNTSASFGSYTSMFNKLNTHYGQGAAIHTNSWGNDGTTAYDNWARAIDTFSWQNDDNLVLFAVTNGSSLKNPENAKNCLAVGATQDSPSQGGFCSGGQGPTNDGRRKPEIFAPGCSTRSSAGTGCGTSTATGTSMAAPAVAGAAALARQYYMDGFYPSGMANAEDGFTPSGPLLKATLLNSTVDMTAVSGYPSNREGWGRVLLDNSLYFDGDTNFNIIRDVRNASPEAMSTGDLIEIPITVNSNAHDLRVTLTFHDAPATNGAAVVAVNNLDLEIDTPFGLLLYGNVFASGSSVNGGSPDAINNVEMIHLPSAFPGDYVVRIRGAAVNEGTQGYAVVISGDVSEDVLAGCSAADIAEPFDTLNFFDISSFIALYNAGDSSADLAEPFGTLNFFDISAFIGLYNAGCP